MVYTELTKKAMCIAYGAHHGQTDKWAALLHDVVEDTSVSLEELARHFPAEVVEAVALLTHEEDVDYFDYVRRIKGNPIAKKVKLADLAHNSDASRFAGVPVPEGKIGRLRSKYTKAKAILLED